MAELSKDEMEKVAAGDVSWAGNALSNATHVYKTPRGNESGSGAVIAEHEGELYILLERPKRNNEHWELPAGFREYLPEAPLSGKEETSAGENTLPPTSENLHQALTTKRQQMLQDGVSAREITDFFNDEDKVEEYLIKSGIAWNADKIDTTVEGAFIREVKEETGLDIPSDKVELVDVMSTINISSGLRKRNNHTDHFFLADLGQLDALPKLTPSDGTEEAHWVKLDDIKRQDNGTYTVEGNMALNVDQAIRMQLAVEQYRQKHEPKEAPAARDTSMIPGEQQAPSFLESIPLISGLFR